MPRCWGWLCQLNPRFIEALMWLDDILILCII